MRCFCSRLRWRLGLRAVRRNLTRPASVKRSTIN
nr:MAG TPA: hypothetical protein [Caudoviricetes sp.]